ncbi:MAG: hypothetical protein Q8M26_08915 [Pseudolabrys sp.]|nr:hypothetical protein [Pseudolabrys sp.]
MAKITWTFDQAQSAFRGAPCVSSANRYAKIAREYHQDEMIGDATLNAALREIDQYHIKSACA